MNLPIILAAVSSSGLINLLIWLLILGVVIWLVFWILGMLPLPQPARQIITVVVALIFLLVLLSNLGLIGCASQPEQWPKNPDGPDTSQKFDADGNPNFGPRKL